MIMAVPLNHLPYLSSSDTLYWSSSFRRTRTALHHPLQAKYRKVSSQRVLCMSAATVLVDVEKEQIPSMEDQSYSLRSSHFPYITGICSEVKMDLEATLATDTLLKNDEAVIAAAAAEALALAKAAVELAKDAALMADDDDDPNMKLKSISQSNPNYDLLRLEMHKLMELEQLDASNSLATNSKQLIEEHGMTHRSVLGSTEIRENYLEGLTDPSLDHVAVKSVKSMHRQAKRAKSADKTTINAVSVSLKSKTSGKKKLSVSQSVNYMDPLRNWRSPSSSRLLTAAEEQDLSQGIQDLLKLESLKEELRAQYGEEPTIAQWATAAGDDTKNLRRRLHYGFTCKGKMVKSNIRLVISIAKQYQGFGRSLDDLVQEGCHGLLRGAEKFDPSKGFKFSTYAHWWIKQAVRKFLSENSRIIRIPHHMLEASYRVKEATERLTDENGKPPEMEELAEATGLSMKKLVAVMLLPKPHISLDRKIGHDTDLKLSDIIEGPDAVSTEELVNREFMKQDLEKVLNSLTARESKVVRLRYGLEEGRMRTLQEIGEILGISRERVRQVELCAFRKLKNKRRSKHLKQYAHQ